MKAYAKGLLGEYVASLFLWLKGYAILERRFRTPYGEVDLLAFKKQCLVIVEVKVRRYVHNGALISPRQQKRLENVARYLSQKPKWGGYSLRFDVIILQPWQKPKHCENVWQF